jgi:glycosyltransferase involved in cell wall biosynthesis
MGNEQQAAGVMTPRIGVLAPVHPLTVGAAAFNTAMVGALEARCPVELVGWRRLYPPLLYRGSDRDDCSRPPASVHGDPLLDWLNPLTWRAALGRLDAFRASALVLPWIHAVMSPPYRWLLRHTPSGVRRVVICHNVVPHEPFPGSRALTRSVLGHADLLVTHAPHQATELADLGLGRIPLLEAFHPRFVAEDLADRPSETAVAAERARLGSPELLLLFFGAVRPYKGLDTALEAVARLPRELEVRLLVAGRFWEGRERYDALVESLGIRDRVVIRDGYLSNEEAALAFTAADAVVLPYRSATQSGVAQLAFAYGKPVIATKVGGLPAAVDHGRTGLLSPPGDAAALGRALEDLAASPRRFGAAIASDREATSFARYADLLAGALEEAA